LEKKVQPKTEIIVSRARVQTFKAWMNGEVGLLKNRLSANGIL
jgi:hypothetical protein